MKVMKKSAFAEMLEVNRSTVTRWASQGKIALNEKGEVIVDDSLQKLKQNTAGHTTARHAIANGQREIDRLLDTAGSSEEDKANIKAARISYANKTLKLEIALDEKKMLYRKEHNKKIAALAHQVRTQLENLTDNLSPQIAAASSKDQIKQLISDSIDELISNYTKE